MTRRIPVTRAFPVATVFSLVVAAMALTGCYDRQELESQAFVTALGIDSAPNGMVDCTFRFALPQTPSGGGSGSSSSDTPLAGKQPITYRAHSLTEALLIANSSVERQVNLTHMSHIVFGRQLAEQGLEPVMQAMVRFREFRPTIFVGVADGKAKEVLAAEKPMLDKSASRLFESVALTGERTGLIPVVYLQDLSRIVESHGAGGVLPLFSVNRSVEEDPKGEGGVTGTGGDVFTPGKVPRAGGDPVEWMGAVVLRGDRVVGELSGRDTIELDFLQGRLRDTKLDFKDPLNPGQYVGLSIRRERPPNFAIRLENPLQVRVNVPLEADLLNVESGVDYSVPDNRRKLETALEQEMAKELTNLLTRLLHDEGADVIPVANHARAQFATHQQFLQYPWAAQLRTADIRVDVELRIRRFGVQMVPL
jgi:spore germination protein KC